MKLFAGLNDIVKYKEPLSEHTWFKLGGPAKYFIEPRSMEELVDVVKRCHENSVRVYVLGKGSNILVADEGVDGAVIRLSQKAFCKITIDDNKVTVAAGVALSQLMRECARAGLSGLECMAGIPGCLGGALRINAGGRFGDIGSVTQSVKMMDTSGFELERHRSDLYFGYRETNISELFITEATLELVPEDPERIGRSIKEVWVIKKNSQPMYSRNAGCIFKNPRALSAGALIDKAGLKGTKVGGAMVSDRHANFIVAKGQTKAADVLKLIDQVRQAVQERFDVTLELEVEVWK